MALCQPVTNHIFSRYANNLNPDRSKLIELIREHQRTKKNFAIQDAYKLIYQSVFGNAHILDHPAAAQKYLKQEYEAVEAVDDEALLEDISIAGDLVRLNLRPYKFRAGDIDLLFQAMLRSAAATNGSPKKFLALWQQFNSAVQEGDLNFSPEELKRFDQQIKLNDYPVMHHSPGYREANRPAYRVLKSNLARQLI